jgi:hypothetical protein
MKAISKLFAILSAALMLGACATPGFSVNCSSYQTFAWISQNLMKLLRLSSPGLCRSE